VRLTFENFLFLGIRYRLSRRLDFWLEQNLKKNKNFFSFSPPSLLLSWRGTSAPSTIPIASKFIEQTSAPIRVSFFTIFSPQEKPKRIVNFSFKKNKTKNLFANQYGK
jgi:hypothetical protein